MTLARALPFFLGVIVGGLLYRVFLATPQAPPAEIPVPSAATEAPASAIPDEVPALEASVAAAERAMVSDDCGQGTDCSVDTDALAKQGLRQWEEAMIARAVMADPNRNTTRTVTEAERLATYQKFSSEAVDPAWRSDMEQRMTGAMAQLAGAGVEIEPALIDCRSDNCLIRFTLEEGGDFHPTLEDLATLLPVSGIQAQITVQADEAVVDAYLSNVSFYEKKLGAP
ncbi:MAG: hypothetical protein AAGM16_11370 [Pseudomonadota bacterium]